MSIANENQAVVDRVAQLQRSAGETKSGSISRAFSDDRHTTGWFTHTLKRLEDMGMVKCSSHRGSETATYSLTDAGWTMAGGAPLWIIAGAI